jgi:hypothetical protein
MLRKTHFSAFHSYGYLRYPKKSSALNRQLASRGHGQYPAPPQSSTSIGTQSHSYRGLRPRQRVFQPSGLRTTSDSDQYLPASRSQLDRSESLPQAIVKRLSAGDPVSRTGASRGHGQYPAPPQSRTSIGTQSRLIGPGSVPRFFSRSFLKEGGRGRFL